MIKAFLCDETALLSADQATIMPFLGHIATYKLAFVLLTNPQNTSTMVKQQLSSHPALADMTHYTFITHNENSHFERTNPAFFAEILARVGIEPNEALIISSANTDIVAGHQIGINGYHLCVNASTSLTARFGVWSDLIYLLTHEDWANCYDPILLTPSMIAPQLIGNMGALRGLLQNVKPEFWHQHPYPQEWSAYEIVCHLLESEETVQRTRLEKILAQDNPFLSENTSAPTPQCELDEQALVDLFYITRKKTLEWLNTLPTTAWERVARHSIFGPTTFLEMAHFTAQHDRLHLNQLCQTLQKCH
ncbi:MAG TPA: DinB family protein [Aggregatilineales bacterium]|nr:DinB family protein [Aggregatilineales bacterium]